MSQIKYNYVINLKRRQDRLNEFENNKNKTVLKDEKFIRFEAFDGSDFDNEVKRFNIENHVIFRFMEKMKLSVAKGVLGCLLSHLMLITEIMNNNDILDDDYVGIYEDDIFYCTNFNEKYTKFKKINLNKFDIEFIYLGGRFGQDFDCRNAKDFNVMFNKSSNENIIERKQMIYRNFNWDRCTFSYIIKKSICKKLIDIISSNFVKKENGIIRFEAVDYIYTNSYDKIKMFDFVPHLFYSPLNYNTDIQGKNLKNIIQF